MSYPQPPDWMSGTPYSGWYLSNVSGGNPNVCSTDGWDLLVSLQTELHGRLATDGFGPLSTYDGSTVDGTGFQVNDSGSQQNYGWNAETLKALWAVASHVGLTSEYLQAIQADAQAGSGSVSPTTLQVGIWVADGLYHSVYQGSGQDVYGVQVSQPSAVSIPQGTVYPSMDQPPPAQPGGGNSLGSRCNAIPPNQAALIPVAQTVVPFRFNELLVIGLGLAVVVAMVVMSKDVPIVTPEVREEKARSSLRSARPNPWR